ncbi:hypothetical protein MSAN_01757100 [Mycena sanguinolenta]|uniref:Uncharacterized protein n=1 Tax=Mycena sanguinolenta TaxID=230812 RepID=A0A8H6XVR3_9AGAR|nr:hypothetical protein MSAN_01757100 [Mycena sanguinolenta]
MLSAFGSIGCNTEVAAGSACIAVELSCGTRKETLRAAGPFARKIPTFFVDADGLGTLKALACRGCDDADLCWLGASALVFMSICENLPWTQARERREIGRERRIERRKEGLVGAEEPSPVNYLASLSLSRVLKGVSRPHLASSTPSGPDAPCSFLRLKLTVIFVWIRVHDELERQFDGCYSVLGYTTSLIWASARGTQERQRRPDSGKLRRPHDACTSRPLHFHSTFGLTTTITTIPRSLRRCPDAGSSLSSLLRPSSRSCFAC